MDNTLKHFALLAGAALMVASLPAHAASDRDLAADTRRRSLPINSAFRAMYSANSATMGLRDSLNVSAATLGYRQAATSRPATVQNGNGGHAVTLDADSYYKLSHNSTVWGSAGYLNGTIRNISFTDCLDYRLIGPYTLGDDRGGDVKLQRYTFGGGWSTTRGRWSLGLCADYRAEIGHRSVDPRVKDIVSDLSAGIGGSVRLITDYVLGVNAEVQVYHQDSDVDFYNPVNTTMTLVYAGLGSHFTRFTGNSATSAGHIATGYSAGVQFLPVSACGGFIAGLRGDYTDGSMRLRGLNNLTPGRTENLGGEVTVGWKGVISKSFTLFPAIEMSVFKRIGKETLFGTAVGGEYPEIGRRKNYSCNIASAKAGCKVEWHSSAEKVVVTANPQVSYYHNKEALLQPDRQIEVSSLTYAIDLDASVRLDSRSFFTADASVATRTIADKSAKWGGLDLTSPVGQAIVNNYEMLSAQLTDIEVSAGYARMIGKFLYTLSGVYSHCSYHDMAHGNSFAVRLSAAF